MKEHPLRVWRGKTHSLAGLAKQAKMSKSYISEIETCKTEPSFNTIRKLSKITGIPSGSFVDFQIRKDSHR